MLLYACRLVPIFTACYQIPETTIAFVCLMTYGGTTPLIAKNQLNTNKPPFQYTPLKEVFSCEVSCRIFCTCIHVFWNNQSHGHMVTFLKGTVYILFFAHIVFFGLF